MAETEHAFDGVPAESDLPGAGVRLHALDWGGALGPAIVFLHGGGLNAHTWDVVCDLLHREDGCIALDLRGHGDSGWDEAGDYTLAAHAADLSAAVDALGLDRFVVVGMSLGGSVAVTYAARHRARMLGLVLIDTGPGGSRLAGRRRLGDFMRGTDEADSIEDFVERAMAFNPRRSRERLRRTLTNSLRRTPRGTWTWKYDPRIHRPGDPSLTDEEVQRRYEERGRQLWADAAEIACPTLVVRGGESDMFLDEDAELTAAGFADGRWLRIEGASHTVQSDRPHELAAAIREFVAPLRRDP